MKNLICLLSWIVHGVWGHLQLIPPMGMGNETVIYISSLVIIMWSDGMILLSTYRC